VIGEEPAVAREVRVSAVLDRSRGAEALAALKETFNVP
jgi:hypothetical protein